MTMYLLSPGAGVLVGVIHGLLNGWSPPPPMVALVGRLGIIAGEQFVPVGNQILSGQTFAAAWKRAKCALRIFGALPVRQVDHPNILIAEKRS